MTQQQQSEQLLPDSEPKRRFKLAAMVVMAMQRFQAALNPTYSRGKRTQDDVELDAARTAALAEQHQAAGAESRGTSGRRTTSGRTISGRDIGLPGTQHGHKGNLLFRPLPGNA